MANLKFQNKIIATGIVGVKTLDNKDGYISICIITQVGSQETVKLKLEPSAVFMLEVNGNIKELQTDNCAIIYGNADVVTASNCCSVEGFIKDYPVEQAISVDKKIKVCHGNEAGKRSALEHHFPYNEVKFDVMQINGDLINFYDKIGSELVIHGNVTSVEVGNSVWIKGVAGFASAGNRLFSTFGESQARSIEDMQQEENRNKVNIESMLNSIFGESINDTESAKQINAFI